MRANRLMNCDGPVWMIGEVICQLAAPGVQYYCSELKTSLQIYYMVASMVTDLVVGRNDSGQMM